MGSKNCPETPRQKMISMMYLVLTALLALNVSVDILNAFVIVNESMEETNRIFSAKVESNYAAFEKALVDDPAKVRPQYDKAQKVKELTAELVSYIENVKFEVISKTEGISLEEAKTISLRDIGKKDNYDIPTNYFIGNSIDGSQGKAGELKKKILEYKKNVLDLFEETNKEEMKSKIGLNVEGTFPDLSNKQMNWEMATFYHTILAADVVLLNKLIAEVRNTEADVVSALFTGVGETDFKFNAITAKVVPKSKFVIAGESYEADIFVAAYDTVDAPIVIIGSAWDTINNKVIGESKTLEGEKGLVKYSVPAGGTGIQKFGGVIKIKQPKTGEYKEYGFNEEYVVAAPTATVSADAMNVFYIGVENPVSISVPGVPNESVRASMSGGSIVSKGNGKYAVTVTGGTEATINVSADMDGQTRAMGTFKFRIRRVPDPVPVIAGVRGGSVEKGRLLANPVIIPLLENFVFDLSFSIVSYTFEIVQPNGDIIDKTGTGGRLTGEMVTYIQNARRGQRVYLTNIRASGPSGTRDIGTINLRIM
jgi:gliding motility-associated protein GldM